MNLYYANIFDELPDQFGQFLSHLGEVRTGMGEHWFEKP